MMELKIIWANFISLIISKIGAIIGAFVGSGYEHCVANMYIITEGLIAKHHYLSTGMSVNELSELLHHYPVEKLNNLNIGSFLVKNLVPVTIGNVVGGVFFVGIIGFMSHKSDMEKK